MSAAPVVMLFVRSPELGKVKTRLAASLGEHAALSAHRELVTHCLRQMAPLVRAPCVREIWYAGELTPELASWASAFKARLVPQHGQDLGKRMNNALFRHASLGRRAVIVGADVPTLDAFVVQQAWSALRQNRAVIAPCEDGGYGLIGLSKPFPALFDGVPWGTGQVFQETMARAARAGRLPKLLRLQWDVDDLGDWRRFCSAQW